MTMKTLDNILINRIDINKMYLVPYTEELYKLLKLASKEYGTSNPRVAELKRKYKKHIPVNFQDSTLYIFESLSERECSVYIPDSSGKYHYFTDKMFDPEVLREFAQDFEQTWGDTTFEANTLAVSAVLDKLESIEEMPFAFDGETMFFTFHEEW